MNALKDLEGLDFDDDDENAFSIEKIKNEVSMNLGGGEDDDDKASIGNILSKILLRNHIYCS